MGQSSDQIRQEIGQKRTDAGAKIDQLQGQIQNTANEMQTQVQDTAGQIADQVRETTEHVVDQAKATVDDTVQAVKDNVDIRQQIEERPLVALGAALAGGFLLGGMTKGGDGHSHANAPSYASHEGQSGGGAVSHNIRTALHKSGLEETIANAGAALLGSVTDQLKGILDRNFPGFNEKMQSVQQKDG